MTWKTPIPQDLDKKIFGSDYKSLLVFERLLIRASGYDNTTPNYWPNSPVLKRGQAVCGREDLGKWLGLNPKTIKKHLDKLQNEYKLVDNLPTPIGTIVTIKNFDEIVKMDSRVDNPKQAKVDNPGYVKDVVSKGIGVIDKRKVDNPKQAKVDTNNNINTNNSKSFNPKYLSDLTPEQRERVEFI